MKVEDIKVQPNKSGSKWLSVLFINQVNDCGKINLASV
jgi:hypothetical protein